jgi:DNA-binding transcriptional LysR family regulator
VEELFQDRYVVVVDRDHPEVGDAISAEQLATLPYLATSVGDRKTVAEMQLDYLGVHRDVALTASLAAAPYLLRGTPLVTVMLERVAHQIADRAHLKILAPPVPDLRPITEVMIWTRRTDLDPAHRWLRRRLSEHASRTRL